MHERKEDGVGERQKRGTRCACAARAWFGVCVHCEELGKRRNKQTIFKNDFQNEATLVMENEKANTWQACHSRRHRCARLFFSKMVLAQHSHPHPRHSTCSALASWASSGSLPLGKATIPPIILSLSLCVLTSQSLLHCPSRPCPRLPPGGAPRRRCDRWPRPQ